MVTDRSPQRAIQNAKLSSSCPADPQPDTDNRPSVESVCSLTGISKDTRQAEETLTRVSALRA